jgi:hypothetical protein
MSLTKRLATETDISGDSTRKAGIGNLNVPTHYVCGALPGDKKIHKIYKILKEKCVERVRLKTTILLVLFVREVTRS